MAQRRMFSLKVIDTDLFLDMPVTARLLYYDLAMRADDDGFVAGPKKIQRMVGASEDDLKLLVTKQFIIPFQSGVCVIKHWRVHNYIRGDRLQPTMYQYEKQQLETLEDNSYELIDLEEEPLQLDATDMRKLAYKQSDLPYSFEYKIKREFDGKLCPICGIKMGRKLYSDNCIPTIQHNKPLSKGGKHEIDNISIICRSCNSTIRDTETSNLNNEEVKNIWYGICQSNVRQTPDTGKVRLGKDRIGKDRLLLDENSSTKVDCSNKLLPIIEHWNSLNLSQIKNIKGNRLKLLNTRIKEYSLEEVIQAIDSIKRSSFLLGQNKNNWIITFDWFIRPNNFPKVFGGNYIDKEDTNGSNRASNSKNTGKWEGFKPKEPDTSGIDYENLDIE